MFELRSMAGSDAFFATTTKVAWTEWHIDKAVAGGYQVNPWVFIAIQKITQAAGSVPWVVYDAKMSRVDDHPLSKLMANPNPHFPRQRMIEMLVSWLELGGNGYLKKVQVAGRTEELWPVSPDRIGPIPSTDPAKFIEGYAIRKDGNAAEVRDPDYNADTVVHLRFTNPANPYLGLSPLGAAAKSVDLDNAQLDWNTASMQNRGVVDGVFTFKRPLDATASQSIMERIMDKWSGKRNARKPLVIGEDAQYTRLSLTPVEMDFLASRAGNRDEILAVFGVPPQLVGVQSASTYNNYSTSLRIFWESTVLPLLDLIRDALNHSLRKELGAGLTIGYDVSDIAALQENMTERIQAARGLYAMGVPVSVINEKLSLGLPQYEGWGQSRPPTSAGGLADPTAPNAARGLELVPNEQRSAEGDAKLRDKLAAGPVYKRLTALLEEQGRATLDAVTGAASTAAASKAAVAAARKFDAEWETALEESYTEVALTLGSRVVRKKRATTGVVELRADNTYSDELKQLIAEALANEGVILTDKSHIQQSVVDMILKQAQNAVENGLSPQELAQAIVDTGAFSPERALRIARTTCGTAASIGQMEAGRAAGATHKKWLASFADTRDEHMERDGESVPLNARFSAKFSGVGPRYPLDPEIAAGDRINCRCFMSFAFVAPKP